MVRQRVNVKTHHPRQRKQVWRSRKLETKLSDQITMLVLFGVPIWGAFQVFLATSFEIESRETCRISNLNFPFSAWANLHSLGDGLVQGNI